MVLLVFNKISLISILTNFYFSLFSEHYEIMDKIREDDGKLCNFEVINHIYWLLLLYGTIIKHNLTPMKTRKVVEPLTVQMGKYAMDLNSINVCTLHNSKFIFIAR